MCGFELLNSVSWQALESLTSVAGVGATGPSLMYKSLSEIKILLILNLCRRIQEGSRSGLGFVYCAPAFSVFHGVDMRHVTRSPEWESLMVDDWFKYSQLLKGDERQHLVDFCREVGIDVS